MSVEYMDSDGDGINDADDSDDDNDASGCFAGQ